MCRVGTFELHRTKHVIVAGLGALLMALMLWDKRLETGNAQIDEQHKALVEALNNLHAAMKQGKGTWWLMFPSCGLFLHVCRLCPGLSIFGGFFLIMFSGIMFYVIMLALPLQLIIK